MANAAYQTPSLDGPEDSCRTYNARTNRLCQPSSREIIDNKQVSMLLNGQGNGLSFAVSQTSAHHHR